MTTSVTTPRTASRTARERARAELTSEITQAARRQLADVGAQQLSVRAVARELGMVSSALYRYFPSRDELLTALIVEAYEALAERARAAEAAVPRRDLRGRWRAVCRATRVWAVEHPHEYALVYGSPVPGYRAPEATIEPASRVPLLLLGVLRDAQAGGTAAPTPAPTAVAGTVPPQLRAQLSALAATAAPELPPDVLARALIAWTQLFGMISFELFGHLVGSVDPSEPFFDYAVEQSADLLGLGRRTRR